MASNSVVMNYAPSMSAVPDDEVEDDKVINETAYARLGAEVDGIQAEYDALYTQFMALAQVKGCGWCPRGLMGMEKLRNTFGDRFIGIGIHQYNETDAMFIANYPYLDWEGAPSCRIDRGAEIDPYFGSSDDIVNDFQDEMNQPSFVDVDVCGFMDEAMTEVETKAYIKPLYDTDEYELELALVADGLSGSTSAWWQSNYYSSQPTSQTPNDLRVFCSGGKYGSNSIKGFVFNDVAIGTSYASKRQGFRAPYVPDNNHKHVIVNVVYNSIDETKDEGLFDLDVVTGELTFLTGNFIEDYENYGFNGGGYVFNGKYRGVFYDSDYNVSDAHQATVMEFDMDTWESTDIFDIPNMSTMAVDAATQYNADGTTTVLGQFWGVDRQGNLSLRYATLDANGTTTTTIGQGANKHMLAMGVTSDGRLYGVAKDGNLYEIDRTTGQEICVGHTGVDDIVDYEGNFWLQSGEIDPRDNTFYWMAEHAANFWTQLLSVDLKTGKATSLIDFAGDVECAGMVIAKQQRKDDTPASVTDLTAAFGPLQELCTRPRGECVLA